MDKSEWQAFLEELSSDDRSRLSASLENAADNYRSLFWDQRFGAFRSSESDTAVQSVNEGDRARTTSASETDSTVPDSESAVTVQSPTPIPTPSAEGKTSQTLQDEALNWLGKTQGFVNALMARLRAGDAAAEAIEELRRELANRADQQGRMSSDLEAAKLHIIEIEKDRARLREEDKRLATEIRNLNAQVETLREKSEIKDKRLAELESANQSFERKVLELEESRILYGEQKVGELKRALAERISREVEDMPDLSNSSVQAAPELLRIRFGL